jgi:bifunctional UDP-N-acetylglucosamine pyrophosphorylase/glucosamine-1-phosphate N-acetyltransferase
MSALKTACLILAAGRGSRMKGFDGNKTLLPLVPGRSPFEGRHPILLQILKNLPTGPKAAVINYKKEDVIKATESLGLSYCEQPSLNGTGGALIAARGFLEGEYYDNLIITMGDVPFVRGTTYLNLVGALKLNNLVVLGFRPLEKKQYGVLETHGMHVKRIIEWEYWRTYPEQKQAQFPICNSGIYAVRKSDLVRYLPILEKRPHSVRKERNGKMVEVEEFFITDLVELMHADGLKTGFVVAEDETEVMGVDDLPSLTRAQEIFRRSSSEFGIRNSE